MGIRNIIAVTALSLITITAQAASTNSWKSGGSGFWDANSAWSLSAPPSITDAADFITNITAKTVTIDSAVVSDTPSSLNISNLTVQGVGSATNTLSLNMSGTGVPLQVVNSMIISNAGVLTITNSFLQVNGGTFNVFGTMRVFSGAKVQLNKATIANGAVLQFGLGTNNLPIAVTSDLGLGGTLNILNGGGFTNTTYTLFTYGGGLTYGGLTIGTTPTTNFTYTISTNTAGQVNLIVGSASSSSSTASVQLVSIVRNTNDIAITWSATGGSTSLVQVTSGTANGSFSTNNFADIPLSQFIAPGTGIVTNTYTDAGGATNTPSRFYRVHYFQ